MSTANNQLSSAKEGSVVSDLFRGIPLAIWCLVREKWSRKFEQRIALPTRKVAGAASLPSCSGSRSSL